MKNNDDNENEIKKKFTPLFTNLNKPFMTLNTKSYIGKSSIFDYLNDDKIRFNQTIGQSMTQRYSLMASKFLDSKYQELPKSQFTLSPFISRKSDDIDQISNSESISTLKTDSGLESVDSNNLLYTELKDYFENGNLNTAIEAKYKSNILMTYDNFGNSIFHLAAKYGTVETLKNLIEKYPDKWYVTNKQGETAMQSAIENDNLEILKYLIKFKQDNNVQISQLCDHEGNTLLSKAIMKSQYEIVRYLVENYTCLLSIKNAHGSYPIHFASIQSNMNIVRLICRESKKFINTRDNSSYSPAMLAAQYGQYEVLKYLLDNMNAKYTKVTKKEKYTLLHIGVRSGSLDIVQYLIMKMGNTYLKKRTKDGATIYHLAAACGHDKILEYLLAHRIAKELKNSKDITGSTAAHDCAENGHFKCLKLLHDAGLNMFEEDLDKTTPCMLALRSGNYECQQFVKTLKPPAQSLLVTTKLIMHTPKSTSQYDESLELNNTSEKTTTTSTTNNNNNNTNKLNLRRITSMLRQKRGKNSNEMPAYLFTQRFRPAPVSLPQFSTMAGLHNGLAQVEDELNDVFLEDITDQKNSNIKKPPLSLSPNIQRKDQKKQQQSFNQADLIPKYEKLKIKELKSHSEEYLNPRHSLASREESIYEFNNPLNPSSAYKLLNKKKSVAFEDEILNTNKKQVNISASREVVSNKREPKSHRIRFTVRPPNLGKTPKQRSFEIENLSTSRSMSESTLVQESNKNYYNNNQNKILNEPPPDYWENDKPEEKSKQISLAEVIMKSIQEKNFNSNLIIHDPESESIKRNDKPNEIKSEYEYVNIDEDDEKAYVTSVSVVASTKSLGDVTSQTTDDDLPPPPSQSFLRRIEIENEEFLQKSTLPSLIEPECEPVKNELKQVISIEQPKTQKIPTSNNNQNKSNNLIAEIKKHKLFGTQKDYILRYLDKSVQKYEKLFSNDSSTSNNDVNSSYERFPFVKNKQQQKSKNISVLKIEKSLTSIDLKRSNDGNNRSISCDNVNIDDRLGDLDKNISNIELNRVPTRKTKKFIKASSIDDATTTTNKISFNKINSSSNQQKALSARDNRMNLNSELDMVFKRKALLSEISNL